MRSLPAAVSKPMLPVADRPLAAHAVGAAVEAGVNTSLDPDVTLSPASSGGDGDL